VFDGDGRPVLSTSVHVTLTKGAEAQGTQRHGECGHLLEEMREGMGLPLEQPLSISTPTHDDSVALVSAVVGGGFL
jgi:hypothetical protein